MKDDIQPPVARVRSANPLAPHRWPFFYGWAILFIGTVGILASVPGQTMGVSVFTDYLIEALGLTRFQLSLAYMCGTIASGFILPYGGRLLDRIGARAMLALAAVALGASLCAVGLSDRIVAAFTGGTGAMYVAMAVIFACFLCIRFSGQGLLAMAPRVMIGKWFNRKRGFATGVSGVFVACGFSSAPVVLDAVIQSFGWRGACFFLAAVVGVVVASLAWLLARDNPQQCGLLPDGDAHGKQESDTSAPAVRDFTLPEARRDFAFWVFSIALASQGLIITAVTFHVVALGEEMSLNRDEVLRVFLPMPLFSISANFIAGWISDRIHLKWLLVVMLLMQAVGTAALLGMGNTWGFAFVVVGYGVSGGIFGVLLTVTWPRFFGLAHLGAISGLNMSIMVVASALGPILFSAGQSLTGAFKAAIVLCIAMPLVVLLAGLKAKNPQETYGQ